MNPKGKWGEVRNASITHWPNMLSVRWIVDAKEGQQIFHLSELE